MKYLAPLAVMSSLAFVGCNTTTAGDGLGTVSLKFGASQSAARDVQARDPISNIDVTNIAGDVVGSITLNEAWVVVQEVEFEREDEDDDYDDDYDDSDDDRSSSRSSSDDDIEFVGPFAVDLLTGDSFPRLPSVSIDTGVYDDIEIDIEKLSQADLDGMTDLPAGIAQDLLKYSIYFSGSYTSVADVSLTDVPFTFGYAMSDDFELSGTDFTQGFVIDDAGLNDIIVAFRLNEWFRFDDTETNEYGREFEQAKTLAADGVTYEIVLIHDNTSNLISDIAEVIRENIEESAEYGEDDDDDGYLDDDEDDDEYDDEDDD